MTMTKAIAMLGKYVWVLWMPGTRYGRVQRGNVSHVNLHAERLNRGEWHAYVFNGHGGCDYPGEDMFLTKAEAVAELKRRAEGNT